MPDNESDRPPSEGLVKIVVRLEGSALDSGFESESLWAEPLGDNRYRVWNIPVFAYNLDLRAIVECRPDPEDGMPIATRVVEPGDCFVVRLYFQPTATEEKIQEVLDLLAERDAIFEKFKHYLWGVAVRTLDDFDWLGPALKPYVDAEVLWFESAYNRNEPEIGASER